MSPRNWGRSDYQLLLLKKNDCDHRYTFTVSRIKHVVNSLHTRTWDARIGKVIINFSALELESILWLVQLSEKHQSIGRFVEMQFTSRTTQVMRHIEARSTSSRWRKDSLRAWNAAIKLAKIRNHIAHNPVMFAWKSSSEAGEPDFVGIPSMRKAGFPAKETLLSKATVDHSTNEMAALVLNLQALRSEWCNLRDKGLAPPTQPVETGWHHMWNRLKALLTVALPFFGRRVDS